MILRVAASNRLTLFWKKNVDNFDGIFDNDVRNCDKYSSEEPDIAVGPYVSAISGAPYDIWEIRKAVRNKIFHEI